MHQKTKHGILSVAFLFLCMSVQAQDFHFSQFFVAPSFLNPAYIGKFRTDYRAGLIHRRQWSQLNTPYVTTGATGEANFRVGPYKYDMIGAGLAFVNDELGDGSLKNLHIIASGAYHRYLDEFLRHRLSGGVQLSYVRKNINAGSEYFYSQLSGYGFDPNKASGENLNGNAFQYININIGVAYQFKVSEKFDLETGCSLFNVARPTETTLGTTYHLPMRLTWNGTANFKISERISFSPQILWMFQGQAQELMAGGMAAYHLKDTKKNHYIPRHFL